MKKSLLIIFFLISGKCFAQITTTEIATPKADAAQAEPFDSLINFPGNKPAMLIGQDVYVLPKSKTLRTYGYDNFTKDYKAKYFYKKTDYDELQGRYFTIIGIVNYNDKTFLKLKDKKTSDESYLYYYQPEFEFNFPFLVVGYFEKQKNILKGQRFIMRGKNWINDKDKPNDIKTGEAVDISAEKMFTCFDLTVDGVYFTPSMLLQNESGNQLTIGLDNLYKWPNVYIINKVDADSYKSSFGNEYWEIIMNGKVKIGMTKQMCKLSWGSPEKVNQTITTSGKSEQWIYKENYLYFEGDKLTAIQ